MERQCCPCSDGGRSSVRETCWSSEARARGCRGRERGRVVVEEWDVPMERRRVERIRVSE